MLGCLFSPIRALFGLILAPFSAAIRGCILTVGCLFWIALILVIVAWAGWFNIPIVSNWFSGG